jgi:Mrp family chromosome partitioning ATPase
MKIITVVSSEGWCWQTLALNLAAAFRNGGLNVGILDTDARTDRN